MLSLSNLIASALCMFLLFTSTSGHGQDIWVSYSQKIDTKGYDGHLFRLHGWVRTEAEDEGAAAHLWARVDKEKGSGFFENMDQRPIRSREWKEYFIEGMIDTGAQQLVFGAYCTLNGKFYLDNLKLDIETTKGHWTNVFTADFEKNTNPLKQGIGKGTSGVNKLYSAHVTKGEKAQGVNSLLIEGRNVPNYGFNQKTGKFAEVNGIKLYYEIYGQGTPLVVLHGNGGSIQSASPFYPDLMKKYKVIAIDSRAQGRSGDTEQELTYEQMASDVNELLGQLQIDSALIWGQSDGAILGLLLAMDYPQKVSKVLAFGANIQPDSLALFPWEIEEMQKVVEESHDPKEKKLNQLMLKYPNIPFSKLSSIKAPVMIMSGDRDMIRPEHTLKLFQNIPNSQLCIIPGSTHGAAWEKKKLFLMLMDEFFNQPFTMPDSK